MHDSRNATDSARSPKEGISVSMLTDLASIAFLPTHQVRFHVQGCHSTVSYCAKALGGLRRVRSVVSIGEPRDLSRHIWNPNLRIPANMRLQPRTATEWIDNAATLYLARRWWRSGGNG